MADVLHIPTHHKKALLKFMQQADEGENGKEEPAGYSLHSAEAPRGPFQTKETGKF